MKPGRLLLILAIVVIAVIIYLNKFSHKTASIAPGGPGQATQPYSVSGVIVQPQCIADHIFTTGSILANEEVEIRNEIAGRLTHIYFTEGSKVNKGDLLIKIFDEDLQAQLRKLMLDEEVASKNESRQKDLLGVQGVSQQDYDEALNRLNQLKADIDLVKTQIGKTEIRAPFSGIIGLRNVSEGAFLASNTRIATMQEIDPVKIEFSVPERYKDRVHVGGLVNFTTESTAGNYQGKIYAFEPLIDPQTRTLTIRALCPNPGHELFPGTYARVDVFLAKYDEALMIPSQSIIPELKGQKVFISRNGKANPVKVAIGIRNDTTVQVISGLAAGDTVLTTGIMQLRPDMPVKVNLAR